MAYPAFAKDNRHSSYWRLKEAQSGSLDEFIHTVAAGQQRADGV
jgi:hypothetical protein